jgi:hypothetical protein
LQNFVDLYVSATLAFWELEFQVIGGGFELAQFMLRRQTQAAIVVASKRSFIAGVNLNEKATYIFFCGFFGPGPVSHVVRQ